MRHTSVLQGGAKDLTQDYRITTMKRYLDSIGVDFAKATADQENRRRRCKTPRRFATLGSEGTSLVNQLYERGDSMADEAQLPRNCDRYSYILAQVANYHKRNKEKFFDEASSEKVLAYTKRMSLNNSNETGKKF
tara:strand:- start:216 stop:620 length:405 start_codon:yes stop_codon:yes gene_type:complete